MTATTINATYNAVIITRTPPRSNYACINVTHQHVQRKHMQQYRLNAAWQRWFIQL
ncbi:hypothetical protein [Marinococcus halophilus]|uniref:hypothetical protein n=1 Tax=Marinococcus halophilus TaxID=1371 RepID=UPI0018E9AA76|nr:hypothetical protein [Marinococcus halophilus]